jgi:hypothetical protein
MIAGSTSGTGGSSVPSHPHSFLNPGGVNSVRHSNINQTKNDLLQDSASSN